MAVKFGARETKRVTPWQIRHLPDSRVRHALRLLLSPAGRRP
jgi:hypothetical protein